MKLYHGTTPRNADCIEAEGFLGSELSEDTDGFSRHVEDGVVFLTEDINEALEYGEVVFQVHLEGVQAHPFSAGTEHFYAVADEVNEQAWWEREC